MVIQKKGVGGFENDRRESGSGETSITHIVYRKFLVGSQQNYQS